MSYSKMIFFLLLTLSLIFCQKPEKPKENNEKKDVKMQSEPIKDKNMNSTNGNSSKNGFDDQKPFNITIDEMDKLMFCSIIVQQYLKYNKNILEEASQKYKINKTNTFADKLGTDIFEVCVNKIDIKTVNIYIKNLTYFYNFKWEKGFDEFTKMDFSKYGDEDNLKLTMEQQYLMNKFNRVNDIFNQKLNEKREQIANENKKIRIGKYDMDNIPKSIKFSIFLVIMIIIFGGLFYYLKTLVKKPKEKKKKEKKKKTQ